MMSCPVVCFINPNSTESMTSTCRDTLDRMGVMGETRFEFITNRGAPEAIQGAEDGELATEAMLSLVSQLPDAYTLHLWWVVLMIPVYGISLIRLGGPSSVLARQHIIGRHSVRNDLWF